MAQEKESGVAGTNSVNLLRKELSGEANGGYNESSSHEICLAYFL